MGFDCAPDSILSQLRDGRRGADSLVHWPYGSSTVLLPC